MALKKLVELFDRQAVGEYWKIGSLSLERQTRTDGYVLLTVCFNLYKDVESRKSASLPLSSYTVTLPIPKEELAGDIIAIAYERAKKLPCFEGAEDV